jgi:hypothetical protein
MPNTLKITRINELRNKLHAFDNPSEAFVKAIKKECENEGINPHIVSCSEKEFKRIIEIGSSNDWGK